MGTYYTSDVTGRETEDEDEISTFSIREDGMTVDKVDVHKDDQPEEITGALAEILDGMDFDYYGDESPGLGDLFE